LPELPEVQAHAERLTAAHAGAVLRRVEPLSFSALKTALPPADAAVGRPLDEVGRRGKLLLLRFGDLTHVVHLMQGGRLKQAPVPAKPSRPKGALFRWVLDPPPEGTGHADGGALVLTEAGTEHRAGVWSVQGDALAQPPLDELGPEADTIDDWAMADLLQAHSMRLHTFLRDQSILAGLGRRLANEVCHRARLSPFASTAKLDAVAAARVTDAIRAAVAEGLEAERRRTDMSASRERPGAVHGRTDEPCPVCGDVVRAVEYRDYTVNYCATCQTGGKVLADNTTSKFLR
jgi:formamidopyrimidine-DNA glycosylase